MPLLMPHPLVPTQDMPNSERGAVWQLKAAHSQKHSQAGGPGSGSGAQSHSALAAFLPFQDLICMWAGRAAGLAGPGDVVGLAWGTGSSVMGECKFGTGRKSWAKEREER